MRTIVDYQKKKRKKEKRKEKRTIVNSLSLTRFSDGNWDDSHSNRQSTSNYYNFVGNNLVI